jgi:hypothetical protein
VHSRLRARLARRARSGADPHARGARAFLLGLLRACDSHA